MVSDHVMKNPFVTIIITKSNDVENKVDNDEEENEEEENNGSKDIDETDDNDNSKKENFITIADMVSNLVMKFSFCLKYEKQI